MLASLKLKNKNLKPLFLLLIWHYFTGGGNKTDNLVSIGQRKCWLERRGGQDKRKDFGPVAFSLCDDSY